MALAARMTRRHLLITLGAGAASTLTAACGAAPETPADPDEATPVPDVPPAVMTQAIATAIASPGAPRKSITMWGRQQALPAANIWLAESAKLAAKEGDFDIRVALYNDESHDQTELQAMAAQQLPDMSITAIGASWWQKGWSHELQDVYADIGADGGGWFDAPEAFSKMGGKRIGVPFNVEPWLLHLRKDLFDKAGVKVPFATFEEMVEGFKTVTSAALYGFGGPMTAADWAGNVLCAMHAHGGRLFDKDGRATITTPQNVAGFAAYTDLLTRHKVVPPGAVQWDANANERAWLGGQVAAICNTVSTVLTMRQTDTTLLGNTILAPWPGAKGFPPTTTADGLLLVINKQSPNVDLCAQVIRKIMSRQRFPGNLDAAGAHWFSPLKAYKDLDVFAKDRWNRMIQSDVVPYGLPAFADGGRSPALDDRGPTAFGDALGMVITGGKSPQEAVTSLEKIT
ncbi:MAG: extracellular solute-binding protein [Chloroflexi bacterium]|nr:extracellular solute-binding protein [Chloroflexota bacterium]